MQDFRDYLKEQMEGVPATTWDPSTSTFWLNDPSDRDVVNDQLADITDHEIVHPEVVYEQVCLYLQNQGIELPAVTVHANEFLETDGELILPLVATDAEEVVYLYFAWAQDETDFDYDVLAEIVTTEELEEILNVDPNSEPTE
jgi:hypothetical protein